jgi:integrase
LEIDAPELLPSPWDRITIESDGTTGGKRKPFTDNEIVLVRKALSKSGASKQLIALNVISSLTGATCKELTHLHKDDIFVGPDKPICYVAIRPNANRNRVKKNGSRIRNVPLIGQALNEMRKFPNGFDEFCHNNGSEELSRLSNAIIQSVAADKSFYSYRHRIADKLRRSGCSDSLKDSIMGHTTKGMGMHYGEGYELQNKLDALLKAFPEHVI